MWPCALWLTGLPCSGKSTIAGLVAEAATAHGWPVRVLDGDALRRSISADLGFSAADRREQALRAARAARAAVAAGELAIVATISPLDDGRAQARAILGAAYVEIHVDAPLSVCRARDVKGHYARAQRGLLPDFTGVSSPYEVPAAPALRLETARESPQASADRVVALLAAAAGGTAVA